MTVTQSDIDSFMSTIIHDHARPQRRDRAASRRRSTPPHGDVYQPRRHYPAAGQRRRAADIRSPVDNARAVLPRAGRNQPCPNRGSFVSPRSLRLSETLNISASQTYALVRSGDLPAIKIGGRGQWRVETTALDDYVTRMYEDTKRFVEEHPLGGDEPPPTNDD
jgi:excisionase family DNA binding protein